MIRFKRFDNAIEAEARANEALYSASEAVNSASEAENSVSEFADSVSEAVDAANEELHAAEEVRNKAYWIDSAVNDMSSRLKISRVRQKRHYAESMKCIIQVQTNAKKWKRNKTELDAS